MNIVSIKSGTGGLLRMELSDGSLFSVRTDYLSPLFLDENSEGSCLAAIFTTGYELNADEEKSFRFASSCLRAEKIALQLIARAEQNVFRLGCKLEKRGFDSTCARAVIFRLCGLNLVDDRRYARLWLESCVSCRVSSPRRLLGSLCARGISRSDAEPVLKELLDDETEQQLLERFMQKQKRKHKIEHSDDTQSNLRSLKFLLKNEGFSSNAIRSFLEVSY
jgi:regulatory protein